MRLIGLRSYFGAANGSGIAPIKVEPTLLLPYTSAQYVPGAPKCTYYGYFRNY